MGRMKADSALEKKEKFGIFGASLDALDLPEKVALKQAYVRSIKNRPDRGFARDPYDAVKASLEDQPFINSNVEWRGKVEVESWLSPRPSVADERFLTKDCFTDFLDGNGCFTFGGRVKSYVENNVHPSRPIMIGVDHSQTGGVLRYLTEYYRDPNVLIFDSHTDMVDFSTKRSLFTSSFSKTPDTSPNIYECGSFVDYILSENVIKPERIWILGTQDLPERTKTGEKDSYVRKLEGWVERGVHLISKWDLIRDGIPEDIEGPTYISMDMDVGSYSSVLACRFMDRVGLEYEQIMDIIHSLSTRIKEGKILLLGMDMMEIDVHFLEAEISGRRDCTLKIIRNIFEELICCAAKAN